MTLPIEIGETSSTELPVTASEEKPPVIRVPERVRTPKGSRSKATLRTRHVRSPAKPDPAVQFNLFEAIFGGSQTKQPAASNTQNSEPAAALP